MDISELTAERLPEEQQKIVKVIGLEAYAKLAEAYGGLQIYITKVDSLVRAARNDEIISMFDGNNYSLLARQFNLTEVTIRSIVADKDKAMQKAQIDGQEMLPMEQ